MELARYSPKPSERTYVLDLELKFNVNQDLSFDTRNNGYFLLGVLLY